MTDEHDGQRQAETAAIRVRQDRARQATRSPWWIYPALFVLVAGVIAAGDVTVNGLTGTALITITAMIALVVMLAIGSDTMIRLLRLGLAERSRPFTSRTFRAVVIIGGLALLLAPYDGPALADWVTGAVGVGRDHPHAVAGIVSGVVSTILLALHQALVSVSARRTKQ